MEVVFEITDKTGRKIYLPKKQWSHITKKRPEIISYLEEIKETLRNPLKITDYSPDKDVRYYYKYLKHRKSSNKYILVIVKYLNSTGFIITAYFVRYIK